jgi:hypothetical protein
MFGERRRSWNYACLGRARDEIGILPYRIRKPLQPVYRRERFCTTKERGGGLRHSTLRKHAPTDACSVGMHDLYDLLNIVCS